MNERSDNGISGNGIVIDWEGSFRGKGRGTHPRADTDVASVLMGRESTGGGRLDILLTGVSVLVLVLVLFCASGVEGERERESGGGMPLGREGVREARIAKAHNKTTFSALFPELCINPGFRPFDDIQFETK